MEFDRSSGILLHPSSLPGSYGIGELGSQAYKWIDFLAEVGCKWWQVLPLGPTGYGDSPYQCFSAFAGNPYLISIEMLLVEHYLTGDDLSDRPDFPTGAVDFGMLIPWKVAVLDRAYIGFKRQASPAQKHAFAQFKEQASPWLSDFSLFMALKDSHGGAPWVQWETPLRDRHLQALAIARKEYAEAIDRQEFRQFLFFRQWAAVKKYASLKEISIIGDIPIFVAHDSSDVWANPDLFYLDEDGKPTVVAGVPPDYFSRTGQLWGNPLYRWEVHKSNDYHWWKARLQGILSLVDVIRLDHFRGFAGYWEIPGNAKTAVNGRWVPGPGANFFNVVRDEFGELPIIAEDLGEITPDVIALREQFSLPGMKIFQFAFDSDASNQFLPHNYVPNCVVYTGTHDNDTAEGWYERVPEQEKDFYRRYMARDGSQVSWDMIRGAWSSVAVLALAPLQDCLSLDNEARMNYPGNPSGNWTWRMPEDALSSRLIERLREMNRLYGRLTEKEV
jgi:4-alpha-glucanotransferase